MDDDRIDLARAIGSLELELVVRDFLAVLNDGCRADAMPFLDEEVLYRPSLHHTVRGRTALLAMLEEARSVFDEWRTSVIDVAVTGDVVLCEHAVVLKLSGRPAQTLMSFSSFRLRGFRICDWHQLHA